MKSRLTVYGENEKCFLPLSSGDYILLINTEASLLFIPIIADLVFLTRVWLQEQSTIKNDSTVSNQLKLRNISLSVRTVASVLHDT